MLQHIRKWMKRFRQISPLEPHLALQVLADGFIAVDLIRARPPEHVRWSDIRRAFAYKQDLITYDQILISIVYADDQIIEIRESDAGYAELMDAAAKSLPAMRTDWFDDVAKPPFARNETQLYAEP